MLCGNFAESRIEISEADLSWDNEIPFSSSAGVYIIFSEGKEIAYVGQSQLAIGFEVWGYVDKDINWRNSPGFGPKPKSVLCIGLKVQFRFLAPALESYLIWNLRKEGIKLMNRKL